MLRIWDFACSSSSPFRFAALLEEVGPERFYFDFFDGGHEADNLRSFAWFEKQLSHVRRASVTG